VLCCLIIEPFRIGVFHGKFPWPKGVESDEGIKVHGRAEGIHFEASSRWSPDGEGLQEGRDDPGDVSRLEEEKCLQLAQVL
jgi:hypothetical protein